MLPIIRGRLTSINGKPVEDPKSGRASEESFATREQNLTWSSDLGADNRIIAGHWWTPADTGKPLVSLASEFQESLGVKVGDQLTFDIAGETLRGDRRQHPQGEVGHLPAELLHRVRARGAGRHGGHLHDERLFHARPAARSLAQLAHRFPSVSIFDIDELLTQVRGVLDKAALAVQSVFVFTLLRRSDGAAGGGAVQPR